MNIKNIKETEDLTLSKFVVLDNDCLAYTTLDKITEYVSYSLDENIPIKGYSFIHNSLNSCIEEGNFTLLETNGSTYLDIPISSVGKIKLSNKNMISLSVSNWLSLLNKPECLIYFYQKDFPDTFGILKLSNKTNIPCNGTEHSQFDAVVKESNGNIVNGKEYLFYVLYSAITPNHVNNISPADITNWNNKLSVETDPTVPSHVKEITPADITNWNNKLSVETDTLNSVLTRGNTSALSMEVANLKVTNTINTVSDVTFNQKVHAKSDGTIGFFPKEILTDPNDPLIITRNNSNNGLGNTYPSDGYGFNVMQIGNGLKLIMLSFSYFPNQYNNNNTRIGTLPAGTFSNLGSNNGGGYFLPPFYSAQSQQQVTVAILNSELHLFLFPITTSFTGAFSYNCYHVYY